MKYFGQEKIQKSLSKLDNYDLEAAALNIINKAIISAKSDITKTRLVSVAICIRNEELSRKQLGLTSWQ
jgi:hypothetical protein